MSYMTTPQAMGASRFVEAGRAALEIVKDPCLPQVAAMVMEIHDLQEEKARKAGAVPRPTAGIGLCDAIKPLQAWRYFQLHPATVGIGLALIAGSFVFAGYLIGRK
jgi:hypothetical protein